MKRYNFGLYDMHGNVWEWCLDNWHENYHNAPSDGSAWLINDNDDHLFRGGSWFNLPHDFRSAFRSAYNPRFVLDAVGFRVVCSAPGTSSPFAL